jgi:hypothetical protein
MHSESYCSVRMSIDCATVQQVRPVQMPHKLAVLSSCRACDSVLTAAGLQAYTE